MGILFPKILQMQGFLIGISAGIYFFQNICQQLSKIEDSVDLAAIFHAKINPHNI